MLGEFPKIPKLGLFAIIVLLFVSSTFPQSRSRVIGTVKDAKTGEPLVGANVIIMGTSLGAAADIDGSFFILNVPVGTYDIKASSIGYAPEIVKGVIVSSDRFAEINFKLNTTEVQLNEVVVTAERDQLHREVSGTQDVFTGTQMSQTSGVRDITSYLEKLPGIETNDNGFLTVRGGSPDQVGTVVDGLSFNNAAVGNAETGIPLSSIEQVSVNSGGFTAEYGNFRSGVINITTKSGTLDGYHGTINLSTDQSHQRRFGQSLYDTNNDILNVFLNPSMAFDGGSNNITTFLGWNSLADTYNGAQPPDKQVTPLDLYLWAAWMTTTVPDYAGLAKLGYTVSDAQKSLFESHKMDETGNDRNIDAGFGGPIPFVSGFLGDATFYISNNTSEHHYVFPVTLNKDFSSKTLLSLKSKPLQNLTVTFTGLWNRRIGISPIQPPSGDAPDASDRGGFMPQDNTKFFVETDHSDANGSLPTYYYDQALFPILDQTTIMTGLTINHMLSKSTFYELKLNRLAIINHSPNGDNRDTTAITNFGPIYVDESPYNKLQFAGSHHVNGYRFPSYDAPLGMSIFRFRGKEGDLYDNSKSYQYQVKFDIASQLDKHNYVKAGLEYNLINLDHKFWERWNSNSYNIYEYNYDRKPSQTGFYVQDQVTYNEMVANIGFRFDYYYGGGGLWPSGDPFASVFRPQVYPNDQYLVDYLESGKSYIWDKFVEYDKEHPGFLQPIKNYFTISPRIGVSFPITVNTKFYFNYGHFRSNQPYATMYQFQYRYTKNGLYRMSNPNLEPPRTIAYELGIDYSFLNAFILRISGYYKDVSGQFGRVTYQTNDGNLDYDTWANNEYQDIKGLEINLSKVDRSWITGWVNFSYEVEKQGHTGLQTVPDVTIGAATLNYYLGDESRSLPHPKVNANITFGSPDSWGPEPVGLNIFGNWNATFAFKWIAGSYFTDPALDLANQASFVNYNLQWPDYFMLDMRLSKSFEIGGNTTTFYFDVKNLLNLKVNLMSKGYPFKDQSDEINYLKSLHLPEYADPVYATLRATSGDPNAYQPGNDKIGEMNSSDKPYIHNPVYSNLFLYGQTRDIWFGVKVDF